MSYELMTLRVSRLLQVFQSDPPSLTIRGKFLTSVKVHKYVQTPNGSYVIHDAAGTTGSETDFFWRPTGQRFHSTAARTDVVQRIQQ